MRTLKRREKLLKIISPGEVKGAYGSVITGWSGTPVEVKGIVQPLNSASARTEYGERADHMRLVIIPKATSCEIGWGVKITGETGTPIWKIVSVAEWLEHTSLIIEKQV